MQRGRSGIVAIYFLRLPFQAASLALDSNGQILDLNLMISTAAHHVGFLTDDDGHPSSGRVATLATVFTGCFLLIFAAIAEWHGKEMSDNLFTTAAFMTVGAGGVKALQKVSERKPLPPVVAPLEHPTTGQAELAISPGLPGTTLQNLRQRSTL
jgi:hypothetical protein